MMKSLLYVGLNFVFLMAFSQSDILKTEAGDLKINPVNHGSLVLEYNEMAIYVDPYGGGEKYAAFPRPDVILITDIHGDHLNMATLEELDTKGTTFIVPQAVADQIKEKYGQQVKVLANGESTRWKELGIEVLPMYNLPETADSRHPKGRGNGYVLTLGGKKVYVSGDTEDIPEMRNLKNIDVAFVCMNMPYTMSIEQAASAVIEFAPKIVYPYHYRGQGGLSDVVGFQKLVNEGNDKVEVRLRDWYGE